VTLNIEGVLAAEYVTLSEGTVGGQWQRQQVAHVAAVLREQIAAAQAEAWDEGYVALADDLDLTAGMPADRTPNPYRAAQLAPSRVPGEES
jgi:hypothetical protein